MDCLDDSWRDIFLANHERGALWLLDMWRLRKTLTYLLTYLQLSFMKLIKHDFSVNHITFFVFSCRFRYFTQGLSRLSGQRRMVAMSGGSRPNQFCNCAIVGLRTTLYTLWYATLIWQLWQEGSQHCLVRKVEFFRRDYYPLWDGR